MNQFGGDGLIIAAATARRVQPWSDDGIICCQLTTKNGTTALAIVI